jgi:aspartyl-tRNA(Asn)/glutamyl-tRNA(Gln) amidotransferase subunit A
MMNPVRMSASRIASLVSSGRIQAEAVAEAFLAEIKKSDSRISAYLKVFDGHVLEQAREIDREKKSGRLAGVPIALKDNILYKGYPATCGSKILAETAALYDAAVVDKLKTEGAVILGKTNMDEFAMGSSTENSAFFPTRNPWDPARVPGGSSGGSAAAVAAGIAAAALGSDSGGSVRQPAAYCGLVGLRPTYGRISRYGLVAFASSLDQIGPLCCSVEDCALLASCLCGHDSRDSTSADVQVPDFAAELKNDFSPGGLKIGRLHPAMLEDIQPEVRSAYDDMISLLAAEGAGITEINFSSWKYALMSYCILAPAEASSNLSRFDGVRYGMRIQEADLENMYIQSRTRGLGPEVKRRIILGAFSLSAGQYESFFLRAARARKKIMDELCTALNQVDFIVTPTAAEEAFAFGERKDPISMYRSDRFTVPASLAGLPALSLPMGISRRGLPLGIQVIGHFFHESGIFKLAFWLENRVQLVKILHGKEET